MDTTHGSDVSAWQEVITVMRRHFSLCLRQDPKWRRSADEMWHMARSSVSLLAERSQARRWLALDPLHEPAYRQLMQLYVQAGQQAAALRQFERCREILDDEFVVVPNRRERRGSFLVIGRDWGGACIAVPIEATSEAGVWRPITAWPCKGSEEARLNR